MRYHLTLNNPVVDFDADEGALLDAVILLEKRGFLNYRPIEHENWKPGQILLDCDGGSWTYVGPHPSHPDRVIVLDPDDPEDPMFARSSDLEPHPDYPLL